jgi:hypothetical protein
MIAVSEARQDRPLLPEKDVVTTVPLQIEDWLTVIVMALLACITFANVVIRYFTNSSFAWTEEISIFLMIVLALVAGSAAVARNIHIRIEYFAEKGTARRRRLLACFGACLFFSLCSPGDPQWPYGLGRLPLWRNLTGNRCSAVVVFAVVTTAVERHRPARPGTLSS